MAGGLLLRLLLPPIAATARTTVGMAQPYASMLLEARVGQAAAIPIDPFRAGLNPTDADLQRYYAANRNRYMIPEQRVLRIARIGPEQVANIAASDQEIAAYYNANQATYATKETRNLTQVVVPDQATASAIAARAKSGATLAAAAGANAAVSSVQGQTRQAYASVAGDPVAAAAFSAAVGAVVGPVQSDFGWVVVKVDSANKEGGKSLAEARAEIAAKLNADKRKEAIEDLVDRVQSTMDEGSNFGEAVAQAKLPVTNTPLVTASGASRTDAAYKLPADLAPVLKTGFEIAPNDPPEIVSLGNGKGYAVVSPAEVVSAAPAPLASIREQVARDWINAQAFDRARVAATAIVAKTSKGVPLAQAVREAGVPLPAVQPVGARRIQIATATGPIPAGLRTLFTLAQGKTEMVADEQGRGFAVIKVTKIVPGNALLQPGLISRMQNELQQPVSDDYAREFLAAARNQLKLKRNESAIAAMKARLASAGS
jgi:peptidyl-prolyl cis-trans isomerase D